MTKSNWKQLYGDARWHIRVERDYHPHYTEYSSFPNSEVQQVIDMVLASRFSSYKPALLNTTIINDMGDTDVPF